MILEATIIVTQILAYRDNSTQLVVTMNTICTVVLCDLTELSHVFFQTNKHQNVKTLRWPMPGLVLPYDCQCCLMIVNSPNSPSPKPIEFPKASLHLRVILLSLSWLPLPATRQSPGLVRILLQSPQMPLVTSVGNFTDSFYINCTSKVQGGWSCSSAEKH